MTAARPLPVALLACALVAALAACGARDPVATESAGAASGEAPGSAAAAPDAAPSGAAAGPWDDGYPREWFYAYKHPPTDGRWARMAQLIGEPAPELTELTGWRGTDATTLAARRGNVVLLEFWATWCPDCKKGMPTVDALAERLADEPFEVVQVCAQKGGEKYAATVEAWGVEQPGALDADGVNERAYDVPRWPYYVLLDADGVVRVTGVRTVHLEEAVDRLLASERARGAFGG